MLQIDNVFHGAVITLDLALSHGVIWSTPCVLYAMLVKVISQFSGQIAGAVVTEKPGTVPDLHTTDPGFVYGKLQSLFTSSAAMVFVNSQAMI